MTMMRELLRLFHLNKDARSKGWAVPRGNYVVVSFVRSWI